MATLHLLCGGIASGKSSWSKKFCKENDITRLSSDELRAVIGRDETDQSCNKEVFATINTMVEYFLKGGKDVLVDATNVTNHARKPFEKLAEKCGSTIQYFVFERTLEEMVVRNNNRSRVVPYFVIENMYKKFTIPEEVPGKIKVTKVERF